jgi:hypothetical protein
MSARFIKMTLTILLVFTIFFAVSAQAELKPEYRRNGECYLLIGEGPASMRGIYRLNNPEANKYFSPPKYLFQPNSSIGFSVDLERKIYTFSEEVAPGYVMLSTPLKRQVLDSGSTNHADYGYHQYIHYDHRSWGKNTNVYRTGPAGRGIRRSGGSTWPNFVSAGPGNLIPAPAGNPLPEVESIPLTIYSGKNWYEIPNGAWYSSWRTKNAVGAFSTFYVVYGDKEEGKAHNWTLYTYTPDDLNLDVPTYTSNTGQVVAISYDKKITRQIFAGCLDGCGGASGSGSGVADPMVNDIAFMPPIKTQPSRTYFYSRPVGKAHYTVTKNTSMYAPPAPTGNPLIGSPQNTDTYWIGVSMKSVSSDYVYTIGTQDIRSWYNQATNNPGGSINISAVTVSNQWNQKGGIVFAYDKDANMVYKFIRYEEEGTPVTSERYEGIDVSNLMSLINAEADAEIDDIQADGFGSLFFAMTYPAKDINSYDPRVHFKLNDAIRVYVDPVQNADDPEESVWLIYRQEYGKAVFERSIYSSVPKEIGKKVYAERYYNMNVRILPAGRAELEALSLPNSNVETILSSWSATIANNDGVVDKNDFGYGSLGLYYDYDYGDPGHAQLAVINVPTPPTVISLGGKNSYLDICGPYTDVPISTDYNSTMQNQNLLTPAPSVHSLDTIYYYMVENYPLTTGKWNPLEQPDWDGDGRQGGFITSIINPDSSTNGGSVAYRWRTWLVEDMAGRPVFPPEPYPETAPPKTGGDTGQENFTFFYSPVNGKYIITSQVIYDWYDYDLLNFGDTIDDLPSVARSDTRAKPVSSGAISTQSAQSQLNAIFAKPEFSFMQASASAYIDLITEGGDSNFACLPVIASGSIPNEQVFDDIIVKIDRCDTKPGNNPANNAHWSDVDFGDYHGIAAGESYFWRVNLASQTVLFDNIANNNASRNFIVSKMKTPEYKRDESGNLVLDENGEKVQINPLFVNWRDNVEFRGEGAGDPAINDLRWLNDTIELEAYLEYSVPDAAGNPETKKLPLLEDEAKAIPSNKPIIASTGANLPPTDPFFAEMVIRMTRTISYDMWVKNNDGVDLFKIKRLPLRFSLYGKTRVLIIDREKPKILYEHTKPNNLFADAGFELKPGVGPNGGNPASISLRLSDNNPWEAVDDVKGIEDFATWNSNNQHNINVAAAPAPSSSENYKPVFAKVLNRDVSVSFDRATRLDSGVVKLYGPSEQSPTASGDKNFAESFGEMYVHKFVEHPTNGKPIPTQDRLQRELQNTKGLDSEGNEAYFATIGFRIPLAHVRLNSQDPATNIIPKGYANNTPGYYDATSNTIHPYKFYLSATDSSGNKLSGKTLNLVLHPRDVHRPQPYGILAEFKNNTTTYFPIKNTATGDDAANNIGNSTQDPSFHVYKEDFFDDNPVWEPDANGNIKILNKLGNQVPLYLALPQLDTEIVLDYTQHSAYDTYKAAIDSNLPPAALEDNVEFSLGCGASDNAGEAIAKLKFYYLDNDLEPQLREVATLSWSTDMLSSGQPVPAGAENASSTINAHGLFRGLSEHFPMSIPVTIEAKDNALEWDYYTGGGLTNPDNPWSDWQWGPFVRGSAKNNTRTFKTSIPVYGTNLIIRTIDKGLRNQ